MIKKTIIKEIKILFQILFNLDLDPDPECSTFMGLDLNP